MPSGNWKVLKLSLFEGWHFYTYYRDGHWGQCNFTFNFYDRVVGDLCDGFCDHLAIDCVSH